MANQTSEKKRIRQAETRRKHNSSRRSMMRTYIRRVREAALVPGGLAKAWGVYRETQAILDRFASRGLIHKNKAARHKASLVKQLKALEFNGEPVLAIEL